MLLLLLHFCYSTMTHFSNTEFYTWLLTASLTSHPTSRKKINNNIFTQNCVENRIELFASQLNCFVSIVCVCFFLLNFRLSVGFRILELFISWTDHMLECATFAKSSWRFMAGNIMAQVRWKQKKIDLPNKKIGTRCTLGRESLDMRFVSHAVPND